MIGHSACSKVRCSWVGVGCRGGLLIGRQPTQHGRVPAPGNLISLPTKTVRNIDAMHNQNRLTVKPAKAGRILRQSPASFESSLHAPKRACSGAGYSRRVQYSAACLPRRACFGLVGGGTISPAGCRLRCRCLAGLLAPPPLSQCLGACPDAIYSRLIDFTP